MIGSEPFAGRSPGRDPSESLGIWDSSRLYAARAHTPGVRNRWSATPAGGERDWDAEPAGS
jgi:hypothetical protein